MADTLKEKGNEAFKNGEFRKAAKLYRDAIKLDPKNAVLYSNRAMAFIKLEDWDRVLEDTEDGIQICEKTNQCFNQIDEKTINDNNKTLVKLMYRRAAAFMVLKQFDNAEEMFVKSLKIEPSNVSVKKEYEKLIKIKKDEKTKTKSANISEGKQRSNSEKVEIVNDLPDEFYKLIHGKSKNSSDLDIKNAKIENNTNKNLSRTKKESDILQFPKKPTHHFLIVLMKTIITGDNKFEIYDYVLNKIGCEDYKEIFLIAGIDSQFLEFFLKASIHFLAQVDTNYGKKIISLMETFQNLGRFQLGLMLCDSALIEKLFGLLESAGYDIDNLKVTWQ